MLLSFLIKHNNINIHPISHHGFKIITHTYDRIPAAMPNILCAMFGSVFTSGKAPQKAMLAHHKKPMNYHVPREAIKEGTNSMLTAHIHIVHKCLQDDESVYTIALTLSGMFFV